LRDVFLLLDFAVELAFVEAFFLKAAFVEEDVVVLAVLRPAARLPVPARLSFDPE
jgi:hypothetical protein